MAGSKGRSGGSRSGAGRKPNTARVLHLHGGADRDRATSRAAGVDLEPVPMPDGLTPDVMAVWASLAPHATLAGTLVAGTVPAFLRLCRAIVKHTLMEAQIERDGLTYLKVTIDGSGQEHTEIKAHPLLSRAETVDTKIRGWMKDFAINPFGKPIATQKKPDDPFGEFEQAG